MRRTAGFALLVAAGMAIVLAPSATAQANPSSEVVVEINGASGVELGVGGDHAETVLVRLRFQGVACPLAPAGAPGRAVVAMSVSRPEGIQIDFPARAEFPGIDSGTSMSYSGEAPLQLGVLVLPNATLGSPVELTVEGVFAGGTVNNCYSATPIPAAESSATWSFATAAPAPVETSSASLPIDAGDAVQLDAAEESPASAALAVVAALGVAARFRRRG